MFNQKHVTLITIGTGLLAQHLFSQITLYGIVTDNGTDPVANVLVQVFDQDDMSKVFEDQTNDTGEYSINIQSGINDESINQPSFQLFQNYPNPFNPSTVIEYELSKPSQIRIDIHNILGQKIRTLFDDYQSNMKGRIFWDATDDLGQGVPAGVYIYSLRADGVIRIKKMLLIDGQHTNPGGSRSLPGGLKFSEAAHVSKPISKLYTLRITGDDILTYNRTDLEIPENSELDIIVVRKDTMTDIDGHVYLTVKIGNQWWMGENLKVTKYRNGDPIPNVTDDTEWYGLQTGAYCNYNNNSGNVGTYGRLYNGEAVKDARHIAPKGWHVPTKFEWQTLADYLGGDKIAGEKLKEIGLDHWNSPNTGATNESGFTALPGGNRNGYNGNFENLNMGAYFWASSSGGAPGATYRYLSYKYSNFYEDGIENQFGFSVRLIRD